MKLIIALSCLLALAYANEDATILKAAQEVDIDKFNYALELDNSVNVRQQGQLHGDVWIVEGEQAWTSPEGEKVAITYKADENGYQILSANPPLPTSPPIPDYIQRAIEYIQAHPSKE